MVVLRNGIKEMGLQPWVALPIAKPRAGVVDDGFYHLQGLAPWYCNSHPLLYGQASIPGVVPLLFLTHMHCVSYILTSGSRSAGECLQQKGY